MARVIPLLVLPAALMLGAGLLFGDGMITPAISVLSAVEGLQVATPGLEHLVIPITVVLLTGLFAVQFKGTSGIDIVFGPVLCILGYDDIDQAVQIANDTDYGLAGFVSGADLNKAREVARKIRAGWVTINHAFDMNAAFGGYKHSGNGREWSEFGFHEYLEVKSTLGYAPDKAAQ